MKFVGKDLILSAITTTFILTICGTVEIRAQSINDDLKPATTTTKTTTKATKPPRSKTIKPPKQIKKTTAVISRNPPPAAPPVVATPSEIIARYMDYQQSSGVSGADWESVIKQSNAVLLSNPNDKTAKTQLAVAQGQTAINRGDYSNALVQFNTAAQLMPESALPFYGIGKVYLSTKQPNEAEKAFEKAIKINHNFALAYKGLGDVQTVLGKTKKAQDYYKQAAQIGSAANNPGSGGTGNQTGTPTTAVNPAASTTPPESPYDRDLKAARKLTAQKKWNQSLTGLQTLATTNPTTDVYILMGDNYFGMRAWLSAQQAYRKAAEINPNSALAFYKSGLVLFETNEYQAAADAFEKSLILDQNGMTINRPWARKMADKAAERARNGGKDKKKLLIF